MASGKQTTSNQKRTIATKGTKHKATATAPDMCISSVTKKPEPFDNYVLTTLLVNGTVFTKIAKDPVWIKPSTVGPMSDPEHEGTLKGVTSHTYRQEAAATSYSPDVRAENAEVVRTNDTTTQNHGNTVGIVDGRALGEPPPNAQVFNKLRCVLIEFEGVQSAEKEADNPGQKKEEVERPLGFPGPHKPEDEPYYLEVLEGDEVKFTAHRTDLTNKAHPVDPVCPSPEKHTSWTWSSVGTRYEHKDVDGGHGPKFTLPGSATMSKLGTASNLISNKKETDVTPKAQNEANEAATGMSKSKGAMVKVGQKTAAVTGGVSTVVAFMDMWQCFRNPILVEVHAHSCAVTKVAKLRAFPAKGVDVKVGFSTKSTAMVGKGLKAADEEEENPGDPTLEKITTALSALRTAFKGVEKVAQCGGRKISFHLLESSAGKATTFGAKIDFVRLTEDKNGFGGKPLTKALVRPSWCVTISGTLIAVSVELRFSLLNVVAPGLGEGAATALREAHVSADLKFGLSLDVSAELSIGQDEYGFWSKTGESISFTIKPEIGIVVEVGINLLDFTLEWEGKYTLKFRGGDKPGVLMQGVANGSGEVTLTLTLAKGTLFEHELYKAEPEWGKHVFQQQVWDLITY